MDLYTAKKHPWKTRLIKLRRELMVGLSKLGIRKVTVNYEGTPRVIPMIDGIGSYHFLPDFTEWMRNSLKANKHLNPKKAVIDIGVNVGQFLLNLKSVDENVPYHGFEPNPPCISYLYELIRLNKFSNTYVYPVALGKESEVSFLHSYSKISGTSSLLGNISDSKPEFSTSVMCLDASFFFKSLINVEAGFIKIDVEGYENEVIKGLEGYISQHSPIIICEVLTGGSEGGEAFRDKHIELFRLIKSFGYITLAPDKDTLPVVIDTEQDFVEHEAEDFLFVHNTQHKQLVEAFKKTR